jgi:hypothetical protein
LAGERQYANRRFSEQRCGRMNMRQTAIVVATTVLITAIISIWGTTVMMSPTQKFADNAMASGSVDVMQMMKDAKNLADENAAPVD